MKRKKSSAPAQVVQLVTREEAEALSKKPRVSLANTDHLITNLGRKNEVAGVKRTTGEEKCTLWIDNLTPGVTARDLAPLLSPYGLIEECKIGEGKTYGTLRYRTRDAASMVREQVHDSLVAGSVIHVSWYLPRERGSISPALAATTTQADQDAYAALGSEHAPDNFAQLLKQYKPHVLTAAAARAAQAQQAKVHTLPYTTLRDAAPRTTTTSASTLPLPQQSTELPPRDLILYEAIQY